MKISDSPSRPLLARAVSAGLVATCLLLLLVVYARDIGVGEFFFNSDEEDHAVTGLYFKDLYRAMPLRDAIRFTYDYYAHYPALGIAHWPPLFYAVEGAVFLIGSPSVVSARVTTLLFMAVALVFFFALVNYLSNRFTAMLGMVFLAFMPTMLLFGKLVMLEIPCLALCIACAYYLVRYVRENRNRDAYFCALSMALALLTKQNAVFLPVFALFYLSAQSNWHRLVQSPWVVGKSACIVAFIAGPYYVLMALLQWRTIATDLGERQMSTFRGALAYMGVVPSQESWLLLGCSVAGLVLLLVRRRREVVSFSISWIAACLLVMALIGHKESRYVMYWLPGFALMAAKPFGMEVSRRLRPVQMVAASLVLVAVSAKAIAFERPYISGYQETIKQLIQRTITRPR